MDADIISTPGKCVDTLDRENMHFESMFKSFRNGRMDLSWFSVQSDGGATLDGSPHDIDQLHRDYWEECIDDQIPAEDLEYVVSFVPASIQAIIENRDT
ncbi:MAG TPA: DUF6176 family protein [Candidatus Obscuribacterales bacterium]